jgi:foldase protein PrsA
MSIMPRVKCIVLRLLAVCACTVGSAALPGCGGDEGLPDKAVAEIGDAVITRSDFEGALRFATGRDDDPRNYAACIEAKRQDARGTGGTPVADAELEQRCRQEYEKVKRTVMDHLIKAEWTRQEAQARGISLTNAQVERAMDQAKASGLFGSDVLAKAGISESELLARVRENQLQAKVTEQVTAQAKKVSSQEVADYYRRHKEDLVVPDRRDMRIVITRSRAKAQAARAALDKGRSWSSVAKEYSVHFSRHDGGKITAEWTRRNRVGLGATIFRAKKGELTGPVSDGATWAVFVVNEIKPSYLPPLDQARGDITRRLQSIRAKRALDAYAEKYRQVTTCAPAFRVAACQNAPERPDDEPRA